MTDRAGSRALTRVPDALARGSGYSPLLHVRAPAALWVVRHAQSAGNVARKVAEAAGHARIDIAERDIDVPLSPLGERQAAALGHWFAALPPTERPERVLVSPYLRAQATAAAVVRALDEAGTPPLLHTDERLREKEFGILDRLTYVGIREQHPDISAQMRHVGKFYFRPPGGESWCDVILRLRGVLDTLALEWAGERLLIVAHQVTVNCLRYLVEGMDEAQILAIDRQGDVPNGSVTAYAYDASLGRGGGLALRLVNFVAPLT